jgi:hypothetical protein
MLQVFYLWNFTEECWVSVSKGNIAETVIACLQILQHQQQVIL